MDPLRALSVTKADWMFPLRELGKDDKDEPPRCLECLAVAGAMGRVLGKLGRSPLSAGRCS